MKISTKQMVTAGMLGAISIVLGATGLGMIPMPTLAGRATIMHVPVIIAAILEGPVVGAFTGLIFGVYSFLTPTGAIPADPIVRIIPRVCIGITSYYAYAICGKYKKLGATMAAIVGTLTNTIGFLGLASVIGYLPWAASATVVVTQTPFELILAIILVVAIVNAMHHRGR